jgi:hypothetical protein
MNLLTRIERSLGRFAIPNLTLYLVGGQALALILALTKPEFLFAILLIPAAVLEGEWWRVLTFVFTPPSTNPIFAAFALYFLYFMGSALEQRWGTFRYNAYVIVGYVMTIATAFAFSLGYASNAYITGSIFLAFAYLFPDYQIYLFFVLPVKVKWLALATWLLYAYEFITGDWSARLLVVAAVANFLLFFGRDIAARVRYGHRRMKLQAGAIARADQPRHTCTVCGVTDKTDPTMDFRYCSKCEPPVAYCEAHLRTHEHVSAPRVH